MNDLRSLRGLLIVNTLLAAALLWTIVVGGPLVSSTADAAPQYRSTRATQPPSQAVTGVGNAAARQRDQMIKSLNAISKRLESVEKELASGDLRVRLENVDELRFDYDRFAEAVRTAVNRSN